MVERRHRRNREEKDEEVVRRRRRHGPDNSSDSGRSVRQKINISGKVRDIEDEPPVERSERRHRRVRPEPERRKRKSKFPEVDLNQFREPVQEMHRSMCESCKQKELRVLQDNFNNIFLTMNEVARELDIDEDDWRKRMKKIREWAKEKQAIKVHAAQKRVTDKAIKKAMRRNGG